MLAAGLALAVQFVASVVAHVSVADCPELIVPGLTFSATVGLAPTITVAEFDPDPPVELKQVSVKLVLAASAPLASLPDSARSPLQEPLAMQLVAFVLDHARVVDWPVSTVAGFALTNALGNGLTVTVVDTGAEDPPDPAHTSVYVRFPVNAPVFTLPDVARVPVHPFDAVHSVASVEVHVSIADSPEFSAAGSTLSEAVGGGPVGTTTVTVALAVADPPSPEQFSE